MVAVVAGLIWNDKNEFLICKRPSNKARGLLWEFVGGKVEKGESKQDALIRECKEELDITVSVGEVFAEVIHTYPDIEISLTLFNCKIVCGDIKLIEHEDIWWIKKEQINDYNFCKADYEILDKIKNM